MVMTLVTFMFDKKIDHMWETIVNLVQFFKVISINNSKFMTMFLFYNKSMNVNND